MTDRFCHRAASLFGIAIPVALAVVVLAPVPFMRGLGAVALACAALGVVVNVLSLRALGRKAYWPVGETITSAGLAPAPVAARSPAGTARYRAPRIEPRLSLARMAGLPRSFVLFPGRLPARLTSHA